MLKPCPFDLACTCLMDEQCEGCETKAEYDASIRADERERCANRCSIVANQHPEYSDTASALHALADEFRALADPKEAGNGS